VSCNPQSEKYLDQIMVFRFYFRCSKCGAEMSMKTDPKNSDYVMEQGATRNHEPWRDKDKVRGGLQLYTYVPRSRLLSLLAVLTTSSRHGTTVAERRLQVQHSAPSLAEGRPDAVAIPRRARLLGCRRWGRRWRRGRRRRRATR